MILDIATNWLRIALSLFNTIVLLWLGLTVVLNAEKRMRPGILIASSGLLLGAAFFVSHTALLVNNFSFQVRSTAWWFFIGMIPAIMLPLGWYITVLWYNGFWEQPNSLIRRRHELPFGTITLLMVGGIIALIGKLFRNMLLFEPLERITNILIFNIPIDAWGYIFYLLMCVALSLDAVRFPAPSQRPMGDLARQRARPWIIGTAIALLCTGIGVTWIVMWTLRNTREGRYYVLDAAALRTIGQADLLISMFVGIAILCVGQAITRYELFTGKILPRQGLRVYWRRAQIFALGFSIIISTLVIFHLPAFYSVLLTIILMTVFFALLSWRAYLERENTIDSLRPFVRSEQLYEALLHTSAEQASAEARPFTALCEQLLDCERALLHVTGAFAPLMRDLTWNMSAEAVNSHALATLQTQLVDTNHLYRTIEPAIYGGASFAVPLWSTRGLIGILLLGRKRADGLFTQEEIEIARTTCERLIDTRASVAVSRRLMQLQRERMAQTLVIDQQSRRALHDEVLPLIQTAMIALSAADEAQAMSLLSDAHREISNLLHELPMVATPDVTRLGVLGALKRVVETEFQQSFDNVQWHSEIDADQALDQLSELQAEITFFAAREMIRNAARYARHPDRPLQLAVSAECLNQTLLIKLHDDGVGVETQTDGGTGHGLALHSTLMTVIGGSLVVDSRPNQYTTITLSVPIASNENMSQIV